MTTFTVAAANAAHCQLVNCSDGIMLTSITGSDTSAATAASQPGDLAEGLTPGGWPDIDRHRPNHAH